MNRPFSSVGRTKTNMSGRENPPTNTIICRGAPKLRITLRLISEVVILAKRKVTIWCALPANQLLLYACLQALNIDTGCYTSELALEEWASIPLSLSICLCWARCNNSKDIDNAKKSSTSSTRPSMDSVSFDFEFASARPFLFHVSRSFIQVDSCGMMHLTCGVVARWW